MWGITSAMACSAMVLTGRLIMYWNGHEQRKLSRERMATVYGQGLTPEALRIKAEIIKAEEEKDALAGMLRERR